MNLYPQTIQNLIECYNKLPGIGKKTAERLALATINLDLEVVELFSKSLLEVKQKIKRCKNCNNYCESDLCVICNDTTRDGSILCVVEDPKNVILFEKLGIFNGTYHVLNGLISPLEGKTPDDINIDNLLKRINDEEIKEVILALKPSIEGETTSLYISKLLKNQNVLVSKIAHGVPLGAEIDYVDALTLELALENRKEI